MGESMTAINVKQLAEADVAQLGTDPESSIGMYESPVQKWVAQQVGNYITFTAASPIMVHGQRLPLQVCSLLHV